MTVNNKVVASMKLFFKLLTALAEENSLFKESSLNEPFLKNIIFSIFKLGYIRNATTNHMIIPYIKYERIFETEIFLFIFITPYTAIHHVY